MDTSETVQETARETEHQAVVHEPELAVHPGPAEYVKVAVILSVATAIEVGLYYIANIPGAVYVGLLVFLMTLKFALVVLWFMHLHFDSRLFRRLFVLGIGLAAFVYVAVLLMFRVFIRS
ncbi:MAG: cytochrome C oxidase subunit IV family protein [Actinomycetota bacterium]